MQNLPEFLQWFSKDATPIICAAQTIKGKKCMVLAGNSTDGYRGIALSDLMAECNIATGAIDCTKFLERLAFNKPTSCIPNKITEDADVVLSVSQIDGSVAWRLAPNLSCEVLGDFLKPTPDSPVGCFPKAVPADVISHTFALTTQGKLVWAATGGAVTPGPVPTVTCAAVKTALEDTCIPDGTGNKFFALSTAGALVKQVRKRLIRAYYIGLGPNELVTNTLQFFGDSANRRVWKWQDTDSGNATLAPGQFAGDLVYDANTKMFTIGHSGNYRINTAIVVGISDPNTPTGVYYSIFAGFRLDRTTGATELRFGQSTQALGTSDGMDFTFSGTWSGYLPAGSTIAVRYWAANGNVANNAKQVTLRGMYDAGSHFSIEELDNFQV